MDITLNSLFRKIYEEDIAIAMFDANGDVIPQQVLDNTGASVFLNPLLAADIKVSKVIFNGNFGVAEGDSIEDALVALKDMIGDYEYTLPTLYDTDIVGSADTTNYIGITSNSTQNDITKYLYDLVTAIETQEIPEYDNEIKTSAVTNTELSLVDGSTVSDALVSLKQDINGVGSPRDINVVIDAITKSGIPEFTGTTQSEMNIWLAENSGGTGGLWEQVEGTSYIKPSLLAGQTNNTSLMMMNESIYLKDTTDVEITANGEYDALTLRSNEIRGVFSYDPGGSSINFNLDDTYVKGLEMNKALDGSYESYTLGNSTNRLRITDGFNGYSSASDLFIFENTGLFMNTTVTGKTNINLKNSDRMSLLMDKSVNNTTTTTLSNDSLYLKLGGTYGEAILQRTDNSFISLKGPQPGANDETIISYRENVNMTFNDYNSDSRIELNNENCFIDIYSNNIKLNTGNVNIDIDESINTIRIDSTNFTVEASSIDMSNLQTSTSNTGEIYVDSNGFLKRL